MADEDAKVWKAVRTIHKYCKKTKCKECLISHAIGCGICANEIDKPNDWGKYCKEKTK